MTFADFPHWTSNWLKPFS